MIEHDAIGELFNRVVEQADQQGMLAGEHFSVDGTLIQAWAIHKSFVRKDGQDGGDEGSDGDNFYGKGCRNETHASTTDADARSYCRGDNASRLRFMGHTLSDSRIHTKKPELRIHQSPKPIDSDLLPFLAAGRHFSALQTHSCQRALHDSFSNPPQVAQGKQREQLRRVLGQFFIANLGKTELTLDHSERVLYLGANAGFDFLGFLQQAEVLFSARL